MQWFRLTMHFVVPFGLQFFANQTIQKKNLVWKNSAVFLICKYFLAKKNEMLRTILVVFNLLPSDYLPFNRGGASPSLEKRPLEILGAQKEREGPF